MSDGILPPASQRSGDDDGFSLIEVIVATSLMSVIMMMATGAIVEVYSSVNKTEGVSVARDEIGRSFRRLDKELRYANWVSKPARVNGVWYMEWATSADCRQLVFKDGVLTRKTWTAPGTPGDATTIATDLVQTGTIDPFKVYVPGERPYASASPNTSGVGTTYELEHAQARLRFTGQFGTTSLPLDVLFTARNTSRNTPTDNPCSDGRPT